jgi:hypothetical protein
MPGERWLPAFIWVYAYSAGSIIIGIWGFVTCGIWGFILAKLYNKFSK